MAATAAAPRPRAWVNKPPSRIATAARAMGVKTKSFGRVVVNKVQSGFTWTKSKLGRVIGRTGGFLKRTGSRVWRWIASMPTYFYRGLGYVARGLSWVAQSTLGVVALGAVGITIIGAAAAKWERGWNRNVHSRTEAWSHGQRAFAPEPKPFVSWAERATQAARQPVPMPQQMPIPAAPGEPAVEPPVEMTGVPEAEQNVEPQELRNHPVIFIEGQHPLDFTEIERLMNTDNERSKLFDLFREIGETETVQCYDTMIDLARGLKLEKRAAYYFGRRVSLSTYINEPLMFNQMSDNDLEKQLIGHFKQVVLGDDHNFKLGVKHEIKRVRELLRQRTSA